MNKYKSAKSIKAFIAAFAAMMFFAFSVNTAAYASDAQVVEEWKYASISFGEASGDDLIMGGMRFYAAGEIYSITPSADNESLCYGSDSAGDSSALRTCSGGRYCIMAVQHYCFNRAEGSRNMPGYLYFDVPGSFTVEDRSLIVETEFFDSGTGSFVLRYVNGAGDSDFAAVKVTGTGTGKWKKQRIKLSDAYFNKSTSTKLADGRCDFRIERGSWDVGLAVRHVAVYTGGDEVTGRSYKNASVNGEKTPRAYFTSRMWTADSKNLVVYNNADKYAYLYNIAADTFTRLVKTRTNSFFVTPGNYMYYFDRDNKDIRRIKLDTLAVEEVADLYPGTDEVVSNIHVNNDDTRLTIQIYELDENGYAESVYRRIPMLHIPSGQWDLRYTHDFPSDYPLLGHTIMNPAYDNLVFFCHEGTTTEIPDRLWAIDFDTGEAKNIFVQQDNSLPDDHEVKTGETSGHEAWAADGEHMTFVKYPKAYNVGMNGIVRIDKYGENREYINDDYQYWHCFPSDDNRFVAADTMLEEAADNAALNMKTGKSNIVLVDIKTSASHLLARIDAGNTHPYQPHPCISPDGRLVSFSVKASDDGLNFGIMDISDIADGTLTETFEANTNEHMGFNISDAELGDGKITLKLTGTRKTDNQYYFFGTSRDAGGALKAVSLQKGTVSDGEVKELTVSGDEYYIWSEGLKPVRLMPTAPERLRLTSVYANNVKLGWFAPSNFDSEGISYEIWRNGEYIAAVPDGYYCDGNAPAGEKYTYDVRAVYPGGTVSPFAQISCEVIDPYVNIYGKNINGSGISFLDNNSNPNADSYTEPAEKDGRLCRKSTLQTVTDGTTAKDKTGMFYFRMKDDTLRWSSNVTFTVDYFDNGVEPMYIQYNASDGSVAKSAFLVNRTGTDKWLTASVTVDDAAFEHPKALSNCDFRIHGGADTYVSSVSVRSGTAENRIQHSVWSADHAGGLTLTDAAGNSPAADEGFIELAPEERLYCSIDDTFMYGDTKRGVTLEIEYLDEGEGSIYLTHGTNDVTFTGDTSAKTVAPAHKTGSGQWKKAEIFFVDGYFRNGQLYGADFNLSCDTSLRLRYIKIRHFS